MKIGITSFLISCFLFFTSAAGIAQEKIPDERIAIVHLKNGTKVQGEIIDWQIGEYITLKLAWGVEHTFMQNQLRRVIQKSATQITSNATDAYVFKDTGLYLSPKLHTITGNTGNRANGVWGLGGSVSAGHRFNRWISVGGGLGYDRYIWQSAEDFLPLFAEINGFLSPSNRSFYYNLQIGYAFAFSNEEYQLTDAKGGVMVFPSLGYSWGKSDYKFGINIGYKFQDARLTYNNAWNFAERFEQDILYKRVCLGLSLWY